MNNKIAQMLKQLKEKITSQFGAGIVNIIVYGSYARGEESEDSDLDILIVTREKDEDMERHVDNIVYDAMWEHDFNPILSVQLITEEHFKKLRNIGSSFYRNIEKEGISLWLQK